MIELLEVVYDIRARNGVWCTKKPRCMNFPKCPQSRKDFRDFHSYKWFAVIEEFDIVAQETAMSAKHPHWTLKMCRNPRYWQKGVMKRLREKALKNVNFLMGDILLDIPEAHGVDVVRTMAKIDIRFEWGKKAKIFRKVMLIGKPILVVDEK